MAFRVCIVTCFILLTRTEGASVRNSVRNWSRDGTGVGTAEHWPAGVTYTCVDTAREGRNVLITLDPQDRHYDDVEALDDAGNVLALCPEWRVERSSRGINSINIPVREGTLHDDSCGGRKSGLSTFSWILLLKGETGVPEQKGEEIHLTCDFDVNEELWINTTSTSQGSDLTTTMSDSGDWGQEVLVDSREIIALEFVDPVSGDVLTEASPTSDVRLRMSVIMSEDLMEVVSPFNCEASSIDGQYGEQLTDDEGCGVEWSPVRMLNAADNSFAVYSGLIHLPSFLKASVLQVSCEFYLCPLDGPSPCLRRCGDPIRSLKGRVRRESESPKQPQPQQQQQQQKQHRHHHHHHHNYRHQQEQNNEKQIRTTSIRVLPSVSNVQKARKTGADMATDVEEKRSQSMSHPDPFLYLNPITCSLFLILLTVFLILYVAFLRSLRRSIEDMKREIEAQRSRDKFLVM